jgi:hypothetical protein
MRRLLLPMLAALGLIAATAPTVGAADLLNCSDFKSQAAAQANLRANPSDPNRLDADHDGIACENNRAPFDRRPVKLTSTATGTGAASTTTTTTSSQAVPGAPVTGDGYTQDPAPMGLALLALLALGAVSFRLRRETA